MLYLGADHRGFELKEALKHHFAHVGVAFEDLGAKLLTPDDDYNDYALAVASAVAKSPDQHLGIIICGSGVGVDVVANKVHSVRSGLCFNKEQAIHARRADFVNVVALPADYISHELAKEIVDAWLNTAPGGDDRYKRRFAKLQDWENQVFIA